MQIIAEVKTQSPFGYQSHESWDHLFEIACQVGDMISVHTDPRWGGSFELLERACRLTKKPVLAKGIHRKDDQVWKALDCGAASVLVVGRIPKVFRKQCMFEPLALDELKMVPDGMKVVWNSRDLATGGLKEETFQEARVLFPGWLCQASNIKSFEDVDPSTDAVLIGTHLNNFRAVA